MCKNVRLRHLEKGIFLKFYKLFRDGVGDGQLETTEKHEAEQFQRVFSQVQNTGDGTTEMSKMQSKLSEKLPNSYNPSFVFVVVQKRINTRVLGAIRKGPNYDYINPPPGTVLDHTVTRYKYKDFFLVPQAVNFGTVSPTHFIVLKVRILFLFTTSSIWPSNQLFPIAAKSALLHKISKKL